MDMVSQRDLLSLTLGAVASPFDSITAGAAGNNVLVVGTVIDRAAFGVPLTVVFIVAAQATLAAGDTLALASVVVEHAPDGVIFTAFATPAAPGVVLTGPAGGGTVRSVSRVGADLRTAQRFIRFSFTPNLSAAGGDTAQVVATAEFGGFDRLPPVLGSAE